MHIYNSLKDILLMLVLFLANVSSIMKSIEESELCLLRNVLQNKVTIHVRFLKVWLDIINASLYAHFLII
jgi:hypothetical protein